MTDKSKDAYHFYENVITTGLREPEKGVIELHNAEYRLTEYVVVEGFKKDKGFVSLPYQDGDNSEIETQKLLNKKNKSVHYKNKFNFEKS